MSRELSCDEAEPLIVDRNEGVDLAPDTIEALDRHLEGCAECRSFATEVAQLEDEVAASPELQAQAKADAAKILAAIDDYERERERERGATATRRRSTPWGGLLAAVAAVSMAVGLGIGRETAPMPDPLPDPGIVTLGFELQLKEIREERDQALEERDEARRERDEALARIKELEKDKDE